MLILMSKRRTVNMTQLPYLNSLKNCLLTTRLNKTFDNEESTKPVVTSQSNTVDLFTRHKRLQLLLLTLISENLAQTSKIFVTKPNLQSSHSILLNSSKLKINKSTVNHQLVNVLHRPNAQYQYKCTYST